jgi:O-antigen/teichoic acid export membrane protein
MAGAFAMSVAILRSVSKTEAGLVLLVYTLMTVAATLARFGADNLALRETAKNPVAAAPLIRHCVGVALWMSPPTALLLVAAVLLQGGGPRPLAMAIVASAAILPAALSIIAGAVLRGLARVAAGTMAELGSPMLIAAGIIAVLGVTHRGTPLSVVSAIAGGYWITALWAWALILHVMPDVRVRSAGFGQFLRQFRSSLGAFFVASMGFYLFSWMPVLALGYFIRQQSDAQFNVAIFNAGARLAQFVALVATIQISYLSQRFAALHHLDDLEAINRLAQASTRIAVAWAGGLTAVMLLMPHAALSVFGDYADAALTLQVLAVGGLLVAAAGPVNGLMLTCGHERLAGRYTLGLLAISSVVLPILTRWGSVGVAAGSAVISLAYVCACYWTLSRAGIHASLLVRPGRRTPTRP